MHIEASADVGRRLWRAAGAATLTGPRGRLGRADNCRPYLVTTVQGGGGLSNVVVSWAGSLTVRAARRKRFDPGAVERPRLEVGILHQQPSNPPHPRLFPPLEDRPKPANQRCPPVRIGLLCTAAACPPLVSLIMGFALRSIPVPRSPGSLPSWRDGAQRIGRGRRTRSDTSSASSSEIWRADLATRSCFAVFCAEDRRGPPFRPSCAVGSRVPPRAPRSRAPPPVPSPAGSLCD